MAQSVTRRIERSLTASAGFRSRPTDKASICGNHQGQRSCEIAPKGRTHDCKRPVLLTKKALASWGPSTHEAVKKKEPRRRGWGAGAVGAQETAARLGYFFRLPAARLSRREDYAVAPSVGLSPDLKFVFGISERIL